MLFHLTKHRQGSVKLSANLFGFGNFFHHQDWSKVASAKKSVNSENVISEAQFKIFYFMGKLCPVFEIFIFFVLNHSINFESFDIMMSISTYDGEHL